MRAEERVRVLHMIEAAEAVGELLSDRERAALDSDRMLLFARFCATEVVGEVAGEVSAEIRGQAPEIPWGAIAGTRNRLIHGYFDVDTENDLVPPEGDEPKGADPCLPAPTSTASRPPPAAFIRPKPIRTRPRARRERVAGSGTDAMVMAPAGAMTTGEKLSGDAMIRLFTVSSRLGRISQIPRASSKWKNRS